jgi:hypothetical protein
MKNNSFDLQRRFDDIGPAQWKEAFSVLGDYLTRKLRGRTRHGPFAKEALGCTAVEHLSKRAYDMLAAGECRWPDDVSLATQLIRNAKREMQRMEQEWNEGRQLSEMEAQRGAAIDKRTQKGAVAVAYRIAIHSARGNPRLLEFINCMQEKKDRKAIARKMRISMEEVKALEAELLDCLGA